MSMAAPQKGLFADHLVFEEESSVSLLQLRTVGKSVVRATTNSSRLLDAPGARERQQCPHEIEAELAVRGDHRFGCQGTSRAQSTTECSFWGEPHVSKSWLSQLNDRQFDVLSKPGLFRMAAAQDGSWEVQIFNCGAYACALAARFGKDVIELIAYPPTNTRTLPPDSRIDYYLNGEKLDDGNFPIRVGGLFFDGTHRKSSVRDQAAPSHGACIDDPGGQIYIDVNQAPGPGNLNVLLEAATDSYTTTATDGYSFCNVGLSADRRRWKFANWPIQTVRAEDSLFISTGQSACAPCNKMGWGTKGNFKPEAQATCASMQQTDFVQYSTQRMCEENEIALASAEAACVHLQGEESFFNDCQFDFCASSGNPDAVANAEQEEHAENPQPMCAIADEACDAAGACCNALKDEAILDFGSVTQNNLCGDDVGARELRYGSVLTQSGQAMDLVVTPLDDYDCGRAVNAKNGNKGGHFGLIAVVAGTSVTYKFQFVSSGTDNPITPSSLLFSFSDIDQGKKNKQRESVEVCGAINAIVTDNSELEQSSAGDCLKFTSTTPGNGRDNPENPESMSDSQRARTVAYQVAGSSFTATLGVSERGNNPRKFMFAGNPSVACVLKD